jgi:hypothetical protein
MDNASKCSTAVTAPEEWQHAHAGWGASHVKECNVSSGRLKLTWSQPTATVLYNAILRLHDLISTQAQRSQQSQLDRAFTQYQLRRYNPITSFDLRLQTIKQ